MEIADSLEHSAPGLLYKLQKAIRARKFAPRTEHTYHHWISRYLFFHGFQNPDYLDERNVREFLSYLANSLKVSAAKQNQALSALDFLYGQVLNKPLRILQVSAKPKLRLLQGGKKQLQSEQNSAGSDTSVEA